MSIYIKFGQLAAKEAEGEVTTRGHEGWCEVLAVEHRMQRGIKIASGVWAFFFMS